MPHRQIPMLVPDDGRALTVAPILADARVRTFAQLGELLMYRADLATGEIVWITGLLESWGYAPEQIEPTVAWWLGITHPEDVAVLTRFLEEAVAGQRIEWDLRYRMRRADGSWAHVQGRARLLRDAQGVPLATEGVVRDVSTMVAAQDALREREQTYRLLTENSRELICRHDPDGTYRYVSPAVRELTGWAPEDLIGQNPYDYFHPDDRERIVQPHEVALRGELDHGGVEYRYRCRDGGYVWFETLTRPLIGPDGTVVALQTSSRDVSERHILQDQLARAQRLEAIGTLAGGVAHDFNSLLTVLRGNTELLLEDERDPDTRMALQEMRIAAQRATALTRQLLILGRQELPGSGLVNVSQTIHALEPIVARVAGPRVRVTLEVMDDGWVIGDETQVEQLVLNLVGNARDAMPAGGALKVSCTPTTLREEFRADVGVVPPSSWLRIGVADEGVGMEPAVLARALEPFFTTKPLGQGTGLGLATVQTIVQRLQGHVTITSARGAGTTVCCWLPLETAESASAESADPTPSAPSEGEASPHCVLVVDDEPLVRAVAQRILERRGYRVVTAEDGTNALAQIDAGLVPSLVLTDVMMPQMTGRDLADALTARGLSVPVVFMSGYAREELLADGMLGQELTLMHKPFTVSALLEVVEAGIGA